MLIHNCQEEYKQYIWRRLFNSRIIQEEQFREMDFIFEYKGPCNQAMIKFLENATMFYVICIV